MDQQSIEHEILRSCGCCPVCCETSTTAGAPLFSAAAITVLERVGQSGPQELSNSVRTFATASIASEMLFLSIAEAAIPKLHTWRPQDSNSFTVLVYLVCGLRVARARVFSTTSCRYQLVLAISDIALHVACW
ncbi:unnamed protein product [Symbiodinium sp. CCMP2592]|nr:unnamed protein product [Symbiodinium sp. CCMP2592]